jgi:hypothetical protein
MRSARVSIGMAFCMLALSAGVALADDLHRTTIVPGVSGSGMPGQTGSNVFASCGATNISPTLGNGAKVNLNPNSDSPFNPNATKVYAGNAGNPATNPKAVSQYDNACAQAALHQMP